MLASCLSAVLGLSVLWTSTDPVGSDPAAGAIPLASEDAVDVTFGASLGWGADEAPAAREHAAFVLDAGGERAVMIAGSGYRPYGSPLGDAWALDLRTHAWSALELTGDRLRPGGARRAAVVGDRVYLHGGYGVGLVEVGGLWSVTVEGDVLDVQDVRQEPQPRARMLHGFAADADGRFVLFGGVGGDDGLADTWLGRVVDGRMEWEQLETDSSPGKRFGFAYAHDQARDRFLVCGGQVPPTDEEVARGDVGMKVAHDLWALDLGAEPPTWSRLATYEPEVFPGRRNPAFVFDQETGDLLVWGGTGDGRTALADLFVVATRAPGAPVERVAQPADVPVRASCFGVVDPRRGRALLGFGNSASGVYQDLVEVRLRRPAAEGDGER